MNRAALIPLALAAAAPAVAGEGESYAAHTPVVVQKVVRDTDTGNRARVRYYNEIPAMGWDTVKDENGVDQPVEWFGYRSAFEIDFGIAGGFVPEDVATFVRDAVLAICPSAGTATVRDAALEPTGSETLFRLDVSCPEADG